MGTDELVTGGDVDDPSVDSVTTEEQDITNETFVRLSLSGDKTNLSSGKWVNAFDTTDDDSRNEANSSTQIVPDKTGWYEVEISVRFSSPNTDDELNLRVRDVDAGSTPNGSATIDWAATGSDQVIEKTMTVPLTAGQTYELQARNNSSSWGIKSSSDHYRAVVKWSPVQP